MGVIPSERRRHPETSFFNTFGSSRGGAITMIESILWEGVMVHARTVDDSS